MAITHYPQEAPARLDDAPQPDGEAPVHTRFSAAPQPQTPIGEPRYIHALMFAAWLGRLIDPIDLAHHQSFGSRRT